MWLAKVLKMKKVHCGDWDDLGLGPSFNAIISQKREQLFREHNGKLFHHLNSITRSGLINWECSLFDRFTFNQIRIKLINYNSLDIWMSGGYGKSTECPAQRVTFDSIENSSKAYQKNITCTNEL